MSIFMENSQFLEFDIERLQHYYNIQYYYSDTALLQFIIINN